MINSNISFARLEAVLEDSEDAHDRTRRASETVRRRKLDLQGAQRELQLFKDQRHNIARNPVARSASQQDPEDAALGRLTADVTFCERAFAEANAAYADVAERAQLSGALWRQCADFVRDRFRPDQLPASVREALEK